MAEAANWSYNYETLQRLTGLSLNSLYQYRPHGLRCRSRFPKGFRREVLPARSVASASFKARSAGNPGDGQRRASAQSGG